MQLRKPTNRRRFIPLILPALVVAAAVAALVAMRGGPADTVSAVAAIRQKLEAAGEGASARLVEQLQAAGPAGFVELVAAIDSPHAHISAAAATAVDRQLTDWESADATIRARASMDVAALLAARVEQFSLPARRVAANVAQRMLLWPANEQLEQSDFVVHCETILLAAEAVPPGATASANSSDDEFIQPSRELDAALLPRNGPSVGQAAAPPSVRVATTQVAAASRVRPRTVDDDVLSAATLPGGDLPVASQEPAQTLPVDRAEPPPEVMPEPRLFLDGDVDKLPTEQLVSPDDANGARSNRAAAPAPSKKSSAAATSGASARDTDQQKALTLDREHSLLRLLHDAPDVADEAEAALRAAGYDDDSLMVARHATSENRAVRLRLAEALPTLPGVSARRWLEFLLDDEDAGVRRAAFTQLATTGDRLHRDHLRRRASEDADESIRALGDRLK
jgi:hypothetical protein